MERAKVVCIMAKSGTGKSTTIEQLCKDDKFHYVKSNTTREERKDDPRDKDTHTFISIQQYEQDLKDGKVLVVYHAPTGYHSYTSLENFNQDKINIYAIDSKAFTEFEKIKSNVYGIYLELNEEERKRRIEQRDGIGKYDIENHLSKEYLSGDNYCVLDINNKSTNEIVDMINKKIEMISWQ